LHRMPVGNCPLADAMLAPLASGQLPTGGCNACTACQWAIAHWRMQCLLRMLVGNCPLADAMLAPHASGQLPTGDRIFIRWLAVYCNV